MDSLIRDVRYALVTFSRNPGFAAVAVVVLALGIGVNTTIFGLVYALLWRPLPGVERPERLVAIYTSDFSSSRYGTSSYPDFLDYRDDNEVFDGLAAYREESVAMSAGGQAERVRAAAVTGNYFSVLGGKTALGRALLAADDATPGAGAVAVLSYSTWRQRFGGDPGVIGRDIRLNNQSLTVVGVAAERFHGTNLRAEVELWLPFSMMDKLQPDAAIPTLLKRRSARWLHMVGRLKQGVTLAQAQANIDAIAARLADAYPRSNRGTLQQPDQPRPMTLVPASQVATVKPGTRANVQRTGQLLLGIVGLVLLIACANVANLLLARATSRRKEIAVRLAVGASRARLIRQLFTESMLLALAGGGGGLLMSVWASDLISFFDLPPVLDPRPDRWVFGFTVLISALTGMLFGLVPALQASKPDLVAALKDVTPTGSRPGRRLSLRDALVVAQVAMALLLLIGAGLFLRSLRSAYRSDLGFGTRQALLASIDLSLQGYSEAQVKAFNQQLQERLMALPGAQAASLARFLPVSNSGMRGNVAIEDYQAQPGEDTELNMNVVGLNYFQTMGIALAGGRDFTGQDSATAPRVAIINEAMAQRYWPGQEPIGKRISFNGPNGPFTEIVGVVATGKYHAIREESVPYIYLPLAQSPSPQLTIIARAPGEPLALAAAVRAEVQALDPNLPVFDIKTLAQHIGEAVSQERMLALLLVAFGGLALLLSAVGLYGVMSYWVAQRTREIGVRVALGAAPGNILKLIAAHGLALISTGLAIGLAAALALTRVTASLLFETSATDPMTFMAISLLLAGVALAACLVPARRATRVDPMVALRYE